MKTIDLITGFLGSGKTTFIKRYASYFMAQGQKIGILENDFGAVNVDVMLLQELEKAGCGIETVAGACDRDCHMRRFKTKLIAMGMSDYDRVLIEPSGIFDTDEFFDSLREDPLDRWYQLGNVIAIVDAGLEETLSEQSEYLLASQVANAGTVILSRTQLTAPEKTAATVQHLNRAAEKFQCHRRFEESVITRDWNSFTPEDMAEIASCGYRGDSFVKAFAETGGYASLYYMHKKPSLPQLKSLAEELVQDTAYGKIYRVKGFVPGEQGWTEINVTANSTELSPAAEGQEILIVIGERLNKEKINAAFERLPE